MLLKSFGNERILLKKCIKWMKVGENFVYLRRKGSDDIATNKKKKIALSKTTGSSEGEVFLYVFEIWEI